MELAAEEEEEYSLIHILSMHLSFHLLYPLLTDLNLHLPIHPLHPLLTYLHLHLSIYLDYHLYHLSSYLNLYHLDPY